ncbi:hypothetical protein MHBO_003917 [Bonamia ostreae]|uniref:Uncharacterized protein n=1 Tax=Bonamia ostreae TaxID=126728 RepID=A0ABV2AS77_9EUKA
MIDSYFTEGARYKPTVTAGNEDSLLPEITRKRRYHKVRLSSPESQVNAHMGNHSIPNQIKKQTTYDGRGSWLD